MKTLKISLLVAIAAFTVNTASAQKLKSFGSSIEKKVGPVTKKVPYTDVVSYLGHAAVDTEDEVRDGKKFYYIYVWIPAVAPELGLRMISPANKVKVKNPIKGATYDANASSKDFFDTYITLERSDIISKDKVDTYKTASWHKLASNDDTSEIYKQPSGNSYNSLLRYKSKVGDPTGALTTGLYRIGFTTYKKGEVKGTFLAQIGSPIKLPGVVMAKTIEELKAQMK
ncbi:LipL32 family surface lipoprotein [Aureibaculum luteum]|uniref:LipL32 family surface lipoprotein n=1 Tax=Aureibaculum luteum TaxID=1548456 RepID=UPI000E4D6FC5|nr:LipL32 family surface lipoprotein [Aureibaculum luteum]